MANKKVLIRAWMENYPEAGAGNAMKCVKYDYKNMRFTMWDDEEGIEYFVDEASLLKGLNVLLDVILSGKYYNSVGQIPHILAEGYNDDSQDHDALVQCAIFGEVRYG